MLTLTTPRHGDLLSPADGRLDGDRLYVTVRGTAPCQSLVTVKGQTVNADAGRFAVEVPVDEPTTRLAASCGELRRSVTVHRSLTADRVYRFSTDDNIDWLRDLATAPDDYPSLFDHPYLHFWQQLRSRFGVRVQHNIYWTDQAGFDLSQMPDRWRGEFADHADWLRLTFHAYADEPARPYATAGYDEVGADYDRVTTEIARFAGEHSLSSYTTLHWGAATAEGCRALADRGLHGLAGYFHASGDQPSVAYHLDADTTTHLAARDAWRDPELGLWFVKHDLVSNCWPPEQIRPQLDAVLANPHRRQLMEVMIHEQYFRPESRYYQPDVHQRVVETVGWLSEHGYRSVLWEEVLP